MKDFLSGKKTYIVAAIFAAVTFAHAAGWLTDTQVKLIDGLLVAAGFTTLRLGIAKTAAVVLLAATLILPSSFAGEPPPKQILLLRPALIGPSRVKGRLIPVQQVAPDTYMAPRPTWHYIVDPLGLFR